MAIAPKLLRSAKATEPQLPLAAVVDLQACVMANSPDLSDYLQSVARCLLNRINSLLRVESLSVLLFDGPRQILELIGASGLPDEPNSFSEAQVPGKYLTGNAFSQGATIVVNDFSSDPQADHRMISSWNRYLASGALKSGVFIPFFGSLECCGVFRVFNRLDSRNLPLTQGFSSQDIHQLEYIAAVVISVFGLAWERSRYDYINQQFYTLPAEKDLRELCSQIARVAATIANSAAAALYIVDIVDPDYLRLTGSWGFTRHHSALERFPISTSIAGRVATMGQSETILDLSSTPGVANRDVANVEKFQSCAAVPVLGTTVRGCLAIFTRERRELHPNTIEALRNLGLYAGSLVQARTEAKQAESLTQVLQLVGHSLRSPLTAINKATDRLLSEINKRFDRQAAIELIQEIQSYKDLAARRSETLLFAKRGILEVMGVDKVLVDLNKLISNCVERHRFAARRLGIVITIKEGVRKLPQIRCDPEKIDLVIDNILENAIKYSWKNNPIEVSGWWSDKEVRISISDKGLGISPNDYEKIFDAFGRSDVLDSTRYIKGTGLGLSMVKSIVEAHRGRVYVESSPFAADPRAVAERQGYETTFTVVLPR